MLIQTSTRQLLFVCLSLVLTACGGSSGSNPTNNITQTVYIDAVSGNDQLGDGSVASPYRTLSKLSTLSYSLPTTIYLKRGDVWHEPLLMPASNITVDAYGSGTIPVIDGSRQISNWVNLGNGIYSATVTLSSGEALANLSENDVMMSFLSWDTNTTNTFAGAASSSYSFEHATNTLYIKPATTPVSLTYLASVQLRGIYAINLHDISIHNVQVQRVSLSGIEFNNCVRCSVDSSSVTDTGGAVIGPNSAAPPDYLYAGNGIDFSNSSRDGHVNNVRVSGIFDSCLAIEVYQSNNTASAIDLGNAQLARCGFAGVEISVQSNQGKNVNSAVNSVNVHDIQTDSVGNGWSGRRYGTTGHGMRIIADQNAGTMSNISIARSSVTNAAGDGIKIAGEVNLVKLYRIKAAQNAGAGINVAEPSATSLVLNLSSSLIYKNTGNGVSYNAPAAAGLQLYHNSFVDNGTINLAIYAQSNQADIRNNLFYASTPMTDLYSAAALVNPTVDHNCYNDTINMFGYNGAAYSTVASFQVATGFEASGRGGNVGLTNPANAVFTLQATSDCIGLGDSSDGISNDFAGLRFAVPPASGAYAYK